MKITIRKPIGYTQQGRKDQQEDAVWPLYEEVSAGNPCIVLCDGVGGSQHGEVASQTASRVIGEYLTQILRENQTVSDADVQVAVNMAYDALDQADHEPVEKGVVSMATTLTCVCFHPDGILAAHMGDSRIYHVRPGQGLLYQSADHSLVNALLQAGELTLEEAKTFPRKNVITRAIQSHSERRYKAEVQHLTDVQPGDYIFLCCDGVLEQLTNERLVEILSMTCSDEEKLRLLEAESTDRTRDNYTAYLIPIEDVTGMSSISHDDDIPTEVLMATSVPSEETLTVPSAPQPSPQPATSPSRTAAPRPEAKKPIVRYGLLALLAVALLCCFFLLGRLTSNDSNGEKEAEEVKAEISDQLLDKLEHSGSATKEVDPEKADPTSQDDSEEKNVNPGTSTSDTETGSSADASAKKPGRVPVAASLDEVN